jgi:DNA-binding winged helix-turn-helix (wHTH) protein
MAAQENSKENQIAATPYRFGEFELHPAERLLTRNRNAVPLPPKAFDALLCLVHNAEHLVRKNDLIVTLWPATYVSEANLTNIIVSLRKILGHDAIQTVSRHGYRFTLPVQGEPGIERASYDRFLQARELIRERSLESIARARELLWLCLAESPGFAAGWAWLGRCCWMMAKLGKDSVITVDLADAAFKRAFAIEPELACAHQFYTPVQADTGKALAALARLTERIGRNPGEPESFTGLVHVLRFCGLLEESLAAHRHAVDLDPTVSTSVAHTQFLMGDYAAAIDSYGGRAGYYLDAAAWAAVGDVARACKLLRDRLTGPPFSELMSGLMASLLAVLERRFDTAFDCMQKIRIPREPEALIYFARHYSRIGAAEDAIGTLKQAAQSGFICAPSTLRADPWLAAARQHPGFAELLAGAENLTRDARFLCPSLRPA